MHVSEKEKKPSIFVFPIFLSPLLQDITGRLAGSSGNYNPGTPQCCCVDQVSILIIKIILKRNIKYSDIGKYLQASSCFSGLDHGNSVGEDLVGLGLIDERIVNR